MIPGYIYVITNKINGKQYVGQTKRTLQKRFSEHCYDHTHPSVIYNAIQKYGADNFEIKELECIDISLLNEREQYWIQKLDTYRTGYNQNWGGEQTSTYNQIMIIENKFIADSCQSLARIIGQESIISYEQAKQRIRKIIDTEKDFCGYHFKSLKANLNELTDLEELKKWAKGLFSSEIFTCKGVYCKELEIGFDTLGQAARYVVENNYYLGSSSSPISSATALISRCAKLGITSPSLSNLFFEFTSLTIKNQPNSKAFGKCSKQKIYCPELDKEFESQISAAKYFVENNIWNVAQKTAKCKISEVICNIRQDYKGYHFEKVSNQEE